MKVPGKSAKYLKILQNTALISGIFAVLLSVMVIISHVQLKRSDPLNSKALVILNERLSANPADTQLRNEIRELDLVARKAYFTSHWQIRTGGILLFTSILVIIACFQAAAMISPVNPARPSSSSENDFFRMKGKKRISVAIAGGLIVIIASVMAFMPEMNNSGSGGEVKDTNTAVLQPEIKDTISKVNVIQDDSASVLDTNSSGYATLSELKQNFPAFRGYGGIGIAYQKNIPVHWNGKTGQNVLWKKKAPLPGYNSPIIWNGKIYMTGSDGKRNEVYCFDLNSGHADWTVKISNVPGSSQSVPKVNKETGYCAPTVTTDGRRVYAIFANGDLAALDFSGKIIWTKNMGMPNNHYGHSSSLIAWHDILIVQYDQSGNAFAAGISGSTGKEIWRTVRNVKVSWASPVLISTEGRTEVVLAAEPYVAGYDPASGKEIWKAECIGGEVGPSPAFQNGIVFTVNEYSKLTAVRPGVKTMELWEDSEYLSDVPSPVAFGGFLFLSTSYGTMICYNAESGEKLWMQETGCQMYASPVYAGGNIYQLDQKGVMHIFKASGTWTPVASPELGEGSFCTPAFADGKIIIRGDEHLFCIGK